MYPNNNQIFDPQYLARRAQQQQQQAAILASVEFTDLTNPVYEDRRRRKSTTNQEKQAISNMGIVRYVQPPFTRLPTIPPFLHSLQFSPPPSSHIIPSHQITHPTDREWHTHTKVFHPTKN